MKIEGAADLSFVLRLGYPPRVKIEEIKTAADITAAHVRVWRNWQTRQI